MLRKVFLLALVPLLFSISITTVFTLSETIVYVRPEESHVKVGQVFTIDIDITDVSGLQGFDFCLRYDTTILDALEVEEGYFMRSFGSTFIAKLEIMDNYTMFTGRIWLALVICGDGFANGSGTLATITFNATALGEGTLDLYSDHPYRSDQIKLVTCGPEPIPHTIKDGYVVVSNNADDPPDPPPNPGGEHNSTNPDLNSDGKIDIKDVALVARAYGSSKGEANYNPETDLDQNDVIDILDVAMVAASFGQVL